MDYKSLLENIMALDKSIRFSVIADMYGNIIITRLREGLTNFLSDKEIKDSIHYAVDAWKVRHKHQEKIGRGKFAMVRYEKVTRVSIPMADERLLLITLDYSENSLKIIENILNQIKFSKP